MYTTQTVGVHFRRAVVTHGPPTLVVTIFDLACIPILAAELLDLPSPTPFQQLNQTRFPKTGINFGQGGAGTTYAFGYRPLDTQVDQLENLVTTGKLSKTHLGRSVALVSLGVNDYGAYNAAGRPEVNI